jgi:hypothetical protein
MGGSGHKKALVWKVTRAFTGVAREVLNPNQPKSNKEKPLPKVKDI